MSSASPVSWLLGILLAVSSAGATGAQDPAIVIVFGDSLVAANRSWVDQARKRSAGTLDLINEGGRGRSTAAFDEFKAMLARQPKPDLLVIALGTNDSGDAAPGATERAAGNLRRMVEAARLAHGGGLSVLIVGPPNMNPEALSGPRETARQRTQRLKEINDAFARYAVTSGCRFVSLYGLLPARTLSSDGMHPDAAGTNRITSRLLPELRKAVRR